MGLPKAPPVGLRRATVKVSSVSNKSFSAIEISITLLASPWRKMTVPFDSWKSLPGNAVPATVEYSTVTSFDPSSPRRISIALVPGPLCNSPSCANRMPWSLSKMCTSRFVREANRRVPAGFRKCTKNVSSASRVASFKRGIRITALFVLTA